MLVWDLCYLRKIRADETKEGDPVPVMVGMNVITDHIKRRDLVPAPEDRVYCLTVEEEHTVCANGIFTGQCDGDEDCIMLLLDGLINFSRAFLPSRGEGPWMHLWSSLLRSIQQRLTRRAITWMSWLPIPLNSTWQAFEMPIREIVSLIDRVEHRLGNSGRNGRISLYPRNIGYFSRAP